MSASERADSVGRALASGNSRAATGNTPVGLDAERQHSSLSRDTARPFLLSVSATRSATANAHSLAELLGRPHQTKADVEEPVPRAVGLAGSEPAVVDPS